MLSIRVIAYWGDTDDLNEILIIGPYTSPEARTHDLHRFDALPGNNGDAEFEPSRIDPAAADYAVAPERLAGIRTLHDLIDQLYGLTPELLGLPDPDDLPETETLHESGQRA